MKTSSVLMWVQSRPEFVERCFNNLDLASVALPTRISKPTKISKPLTASEMRSPTSFVPTRMRLSAIFGSKKTDYLPPLT